MVLQSGGTVLRGTGRALLVILSRSIGLSWAEAHIALLCSDLFSKVKCSNWLFRRDVIEDLRYRAGDCGGTGTFLRQAKPWR